MQKLSIIIPAYNEEKTIENVLEIVHNLIVPGYEKEVVVVNDFSTDNTGKILKSLKNKFNFLLLEHDKNKGKGEGIKTAIPHLSGDWMIIQDADLEYDPNDWIRLLEKANKHSYPTCVYGSRNIGDRERGYLHYAMGVWALSTLINILLGTKLTDTYTCYKLIPVNLIKKLNIESSGFEFEAEVTVKLLKNGSDIKEVPIVYRPRDFKEGKKIKAVDGLKGLWTILKWKFKK